MRIIATVSPGEGRILARFGVRSKQDAIVASDLAHMVPGHRWRKKDRTWSYPLSVDTCHQMRKAWGDDLKITKSLGDWYRQSVESRNSQVHLGTAKNAVLERLPAVAPRLANTLREDQRVGVAWLARGYQNAGILADKPGLGKTLETIGGILEADVKGPILIVCPKLSVKSVWLREWNRWTDEVVYMARGTRAKREEAIEEFFSDPAERKVLIVVAEMLRVVRPAPTASEPKSAKKRRGRVVGYQFPQLFDQRRLQGGWSAVVVDESHRLMGSLTVAKGNLMGEGLTLLPLRRDARKISVTGTPFGQGGRTYGMFGTLHWCWPTEFRSFWRWIDQHFETEEAYIGRGKTTKKIVGLRGGAGGEALLEDLGPRILRRTKEEVLKDLPPKQYVDVICEMEGEQFRQYQRMHLDGEVKVQGGILSTMGVLAAITRAKQLANGVVKIGKNGKVQFTGESCKLEALMENLDARGITDGSGDTKVIVASQYNEFLDVVRKRLDKEKIKYHLLVGSTSDKERESSMARFQANGGPRVFLINSKAGGVSITLDAADEVHCLDEMWNPEDNEQLEDRAHRASRIHQVTIFYYRTEGTIDQSIAEDVEGKRFEQFRILDGRRGLEYLRNLIHPSR